MIENFFMPNIDEITARDKWNELNKSINGSDAHRFSPVESVRYVINDRSALDRVGEPSLYNSKKVMAIIESDDKITVFSGDDCSMKHVLDKVDEYGKKRIQYFPC